MKDMTITVRDIAKEANVSVATVSRVLNNSDRVTAKTKAKVQAVIDKYEFKPNALARSLYKKRTKIIGCILPDITNHYYAKMFLEIEKYAHELGYTTFLCNSMNDKSLESLYMSKMIEQQVDGVIFMGGRTTDCHSTQSDKNEIIALAKVCPTVVINGELDDSNVYIINTDESHAIDQMMDYLIGKGHKSFGLMGGVDTITVSAVKFKAFEDACQKYGLSEADWFIKTGGYDVASGSQLLRDLYSSKTIPDVIIGINDEVTVGMLHACLELGLSIPFDVSLLGYDNTDLTLNSYPRLSTYSHPYKAIGHMAIDTIDKCLNNEIAVKYQRLKGKLIERNSISSK